MEKIVSTKNCKNCTKEFSVTDRDQNFYKKMAVPEPTFCPACRMQRRMAFRNERNLYKRKCDFSGRDIISVYPPTSKYKIYDQKIWWKDDWDPMEYGREFDFDRPFFEQFNDLLLEVPRQSLQLVNCENSDYGNDCDGSKNCYLCFNSGTVEDSYYCTTYGRNSKNCMDMFWSITCELCYECSKVTQGYHSFWCFNCTNVTDCYFCDDCRSCEYCFGCVGLRHKKYHIYNKKVSKEEYENFIKNFHFTYDEIEKAKVKLKELRLTVPYKNLQIVSSEDSEGDFLEGCKNCTECFDVIMSADSKYVWDGLIDGGYDCFNTGVDTKFVYECLVAYYANNIKFANISFYCSDVQYSDSVYNSEHLFGCVGLRHKKYCILNKQYTKEEYEKLLPKIIEHMKETGEYGEFFPASLSSFGYNDTMAQEYFPLTKKETDKQGFNWNDYVQPKPEGIKTIKAKDLPESISDITDDVLNWVIECEKDGKPFKIIPQELKFYKKEGLSLPHLCPDCRHYERKWKVNPRKLYDRTCGKCGEDMKTTFAPDRPEKVYCESCYLKEIV
ncbi:zinc-ribbon domain containing protein [Patescibacteria group bacterium]